MISLNGTVIVPTLFPDRTSQVWKLPKELFSWPYFAQVEWLWGHEGELIQLAQLKMLLDQHKIVAYLNIPYLPYARQDKEISNESTFALHAFAKILNSMRFKLIQILDPHSMKATELIKNSIAIFPIEALKNAIKELKPDIICYPDRGALFKYSDHYQEITIPKINAYKVRDAQTGTITQSEIADFDGMPEKILIVDDICDGGATFVKLTQHLLEKGAKEVNLFVTHGFFSKGLEPLRKAGIKRIFTHQGDQNDL